jgi:hypothetical protein
VTFLRQENELMRLKATSTQVKMFEHQRAAERAQTALVRVPPSVVPVLGWGRHQAEEAGGGAWAGGGQGKARIGAKGDQDAEWRPEAHGDGVPAEWQGL